MALILGNVRPHRWQFGDLITVNIVCRGDLLEFLRQKVAAVPAIGGKYRNDLIHAFRRRQVTVLSRMAWLSAWLASATAAGGFRSPRGRGPVGGGWLGRVSGIFFAASELTLQIGNLSVSISDLLPRLVDLLPQMFDFFAEAFVLSPQFVWRQ